MTNQYALAKFTGFTEREVRQLCERYHMSFEQTKDWYDGYTVNGISIYNPRSVTSAMMNGIFDSCWTQTETYEALKMYIVRNENGLRDKIIRMIAGEHISINTKTFQNDTCTFETADDILTLLVHLGYLTYDFDTKTAWIPNKEVRQATFPSEKVLDKVLQLYQYLMLIKGWRNDESHISPTASEQEVDTAISIIISMYFYVTGISITDLEMAGHDVSEIIAPESISISHHCCRLYSVTNDGRYSGIAAESIDVRELPEEKRIKILKKCIVKLLGYDPKKSAFSKQRHWEAIYRIAADKGFIIDGDYAYFKSIIDGMQLSNIPVPFNTDLLERLNQGIYAKNIRDWSSEGLDGKKLQEYKDIKNCADAFNRVVDETTQQKENL